MSTLRTSISRNGAKTQRAKRSIKASEIQNQLKRLGNPQTATFLQRFFKTGPGEYGDGDRFRGIRVPVLRKLAKDCQHLSLNEIGKLIRSPYHEDRAVALMILVTVYLRADEALKAKIYTMYLKNTRYINSWDLVDMSAPIIVGTFVQNTDRDVLYRLTNSSSLWERRIAILATFHFIKAGEVDETFKIAEKLLNDREDLIHKAVGWMLREVGNRDMKAEENFLAQHYRRMPRTMLRYAIENFPEAKRQKYLKGKVDE
jgi:3-methyladenine DNA glycosylase AlkD